MNNRKIIKNILLIVIFFSFFAVLKTPDKTYSIYKETLIYLFFCFSLQLFEDDYYFGIFFLLLIYLFSN